MKPKDKVRARRATTAATAIADTEADQIKLPPLAWRKESAAKVRNIVVVSDTHVGCRLGLCHPDGAELDDGGRYMPSRLQLKVWEMWREFWDVWVPSVVHREPYAVVVNGDVVDGWHHLATTQWSMNLEDQQDHAVKIFEPIAQGCEGRLYWTRGTPAHVGQSSIDEERVAKRLGAIPNREKQHARWELWKACGDALCHFNHHVGTTGSNHFESTAVHKELVEAFTESGRWGQRPPDIVIRSHRHRCMETRIPSSKGYAISFVTAGFQLRTPFAYRIAGARQATPQIGGSVIRQGDEETHVRHRVWTIERPAVE